MTAISQMNGAGHPAAINGHHPHHVSTLNGQVSSLNGLTGLNGSLNGLNGLNGSLNGLNGLTSTYSLPYLQSLSALGRYRTLLKIYVCI